MANLTDIMFRGRGGETDSEDDTSDSAPIDTALVPISGRDMAQSVAAHCNVMGEAFDGGIDRIALMSDDEIIVSAQAAVEVGKRADYYIVRCAIEIRSRIESRLGSGTRDIEGLGIEASMKRFASHVGIAPDALKALMTAYTRCFPDGVQPEDAPVIAMLPRQALIVASRAENPQEAIQTAMDRSQEPGFTVNAFAHEVNANKKERVQAKEENREPNEFRCISLRMDAASHDALHRLSNKTNTDIHTLICRAVVHYERVHQQAPDADVMWVPIDAATFEAMGGVVADFNAGHSSEHTTETYLEAYCKGKVKRRAEGAASAGKQPVKAARAA